MIYNVFWCDQVIFESKNFTNKKTALNYALKHLENPFDFVRIEVQEQAKVEE